MAVERPLVEIIPGDVPLALEKGDKKRVVYRRPNPLYRKSTLRKMSPTTRELARLIGEATSVVRRLKAMLAEVKALEERDMARREEMAKVLDRLTDKKED